MPNDKKIFKSIKSYLNQIESHIIKLVNVRHDDYLRDYYKKEIEKSFLYNIDKKFEKVHNKNNKIYIKLENRKDYLINLFNIL